MSTVSRCTYCGDLASTVDHVPPRAIRPYNINTVPACMMCNCQILGGINMMTVRERQEYVRAFLRTSHKRWAIKWRRLHAKEFPRLFQNDEELLEYRRQQIMAKRRKEEWARAFPRTANAR